tara:strand:- start:3409 stop:4869 length:1461 start_codon:yes stop_codon:yes gene_type:complete
MTPVNTNTSLDFLNRGSFQTGTLREGSKTTNFLNQLYNYPPKLKIKWGGLDELNEDLFLENNYGVLEHSFPFMDFIQGWFFTERPSDSVPRGYTYQDFINGFLDKRYTSDFYNKKTQELQTSVAPIPVFVILNGYNEIVLNSSKESLKDKTPDNFINQQIYDFCGAFDTYVEKRPQLGFFFFDREDAEMYLEEIAKTDSAGTNLLGLSVHCIGLDSAYKITRQHHPGIDFRFVPNLKEVKSLITKNLVDPSIIVEEGQQQLRFRPRKGNLFPYMGKVGTTISPKVSFLERNEYFKGVPIYIVQITKSPRNIFLNQYFHIVGSFDGAYGKFIQYFDNIIGFGNNWIMQGSLTEAGNSNKFVNYVFFNKDQAKKFIKTKGSRVARFSGSRTSNVEKFVRKPKIYVYNLEDFIELWEEKLTTQQKKFSTAVDCDETYFIPPKDVLEEVQELQKLSKENRISKMIVQTLDIKYRKFKCFLDIFFGVSYFT